MLETRDSVRENGLESVPSSERERREEELLLREVHELLYIVEIVLVPLVGEVLPQVELDEEVRRGQRRVAH